MSNSYAEEVLGDNVKGMIQIEDYKGSELPFDKWKVKSPMGDIIMAEYVDSPDGESIERGGILLPKSMMEKTWRVAKALKCGPKVMTVKEGDHFICPGDKGIPAVQLSAGGKKKQILFLDEARIFCTVVSNDR